MRYVPTLCWFGLTLAAISCDTGDTSGAKNSVCPIGDVSCGAYCVPAGTCIGSMGGASSTGGAPPVPVDPGPFTSPDCTDTASASGNLVNRYDGLSIQAPDAQKTYFLSTNWWSKFDGQTVKYQGLSFTIGNSKAVATTDNNPIGFPTLFIGNYQGHVTAGSNLPKPVSALTTVPTIFSTNAADGPRDQYNATYDVWFTPTNAPLSSSAVSPPVGGAYLMVWLFKPGYRQPRGAVKQNAHTVAGVGGTWQVWVDSTDPLCISYVATNPINGLAFDLNAFIQDSVTNNYGIKSSMSLSVVFAGFEIWSGGDGLQVKNFCAKVN